MDEYREMRLFHAKLVRAGRAEDIFEISGDDPDEQLAMVREDYRFLSRLFDPKIYIALKDAENLARAHEAQDLLDRFLGEAEEKIMRGEFDTYTTGKPVQDSFTLKTRKRAYVLKQEPLAEGDISTVYAGYYDEGEFAQTVTVKILSDKEEIEAMRNEVRILQLFEKNQDERLVHLPVLLDQFRTTDGGMGLVFKRFNGYSVEEVLNSPLFADGIPQKHVVWMLNRLLRVLEYVHDLGVIHCNIDPSHLLIRPYDHNLCLIGWSWAANDPENTGEGFKMENQEGYSAPEVFDRKPPIPPSDLYSVGKCAIRMLGGDIDTDDMPDGVDERLKRFVQFFVRTSPLQRARDAGDMRETLLRFIEEMWGPRVFLNFSLKAEELQTGE